MNHSCTPNGIIVRQQGSGCHFKCTDRIAAGEELTISYGSNYFSDKSRDCLCRSCSSYRISQQVTDLPVTRQQAQRFRELNIDPEIQPAKKVKASKTRVLQPGAGRIIPAPLVDVPFPACPMPSGTAQSNYVSFITNHTLFRGNLNIGVKFLVSDKEYTIHIQTLLACSNGPESLSIYIDSLLENSRFKYIHLRKKLSELFAMKLITLNNKLCSQLSLGSIQTSRKLKKLGHNWSTRFRRQVDTVDYTYVTRGYTSLSNFKRSVKLKSIRPSTDRLTRCPYI